MELTKIDPVQFGLSEVQATEIANKFLPVLSAMQPLLDEYEEIKDLDPANPNNAKTFGELRKKLVKVRTTCASIHKTEKAYFLNGGKYVDTYKNKQLEMSEEIEADLSEKEKFAEIQEQNRKKELQLQRVALLMPYGMDGSTMALCDMTEEVFNMVLSGAKVQYEKSIADQKEAERLAELKAEQDRLEAEEQRKKQIAEAEERATKAALEKAEADRIKAEFEASERLRLAEEKAKAELEKAKQDAEYTEYLVEYNIAKEYDDYLQKIKDEKIANEISKKCKLNKEKAEYFLLANGFEKMMSGGFSNTKYFYVMGTEFYSHLESDDDLNLFKASIIEANKKAHKAESDKVEADRKKAELLLELKAEKQRQAEIEKERLASLAPDKEKAEKYIADIRAIKFPEFTTEDYAQRKAKFGNMMKMAIKELIGE
jgi:hypothetical protein